jgi:hypothetical protein
MRSVLVGLVAVAFACGGISEEDLPETRPDPPKGRALPDAGEVRAASSAGTGGTTGQGGVNSEAPEAGSSGASETPSVGGRSTMGGASSGGAGPSNELPVCETTPVVECTGTTSSYNANGTYQGFCDGEDGTGWGAYCEGAWCNCARSGQSVCRCARASDEPGSCCFED